ncbi:hypothetical protein CDAR_125071 [Caerostris darwini]|uniref:Uncharacterized protein n=1 Tax=Caerostris darwini TaxID=1538125 RepID=A0AAV4MGB0_9ARAC|nr:hypothetical protein CDAR_125071 [Caerostris darwini]
MRGQPMYEYPRVQAPCPALPFGRVKKESIPCPFVEQRITQQQQTHLTTIIRKQIQKYSLNTFTTLVPFGPEDFKPSPFFTHFFGLMNVMLEIYFSFSIGISMRENAATMKTPHLLSFQKIVPPMRGQPKYQYPRIQAPCPALPFGRLKKNKTKW